VNLKWIKHPLSSPAMLVRNKNPDVEVAVALDRSLVDNDSDQLAYTRLG